VLGNYLSRSQLGATTFRCSRRAPHPVSFRPFAPARCYGSGMLLPHRPTTAFAHLPIRGYGGKNERALRCMSPASC
jgi:hypothetical protein